MGAGATACNKKFASWNGYTEKDGRVQKYIISDYNKRTKRHLNCKTTPWCQIAAIEAQLQSSSVKRAYITSGCKQSKAWYVSNGRWKKRGTKKLALGWQVFYSFPNKKGKRSSVPVHTGIIYGIKGAYIYVREGNMGSGRVGGRKIKYNSADINGFGVPYYK